MPEDDEEVKAQELHDGKRDLGIVQSHAAQLAEHFDTVQILCTKQTPDGTAAIEFGEGNWYARREHARQFLLKK